MRKTSDKLSQLRDILETVTNSPQNCQDDHKQKSLRHFVAKRTLPGDKTTKCKWYTSWDSGTENNIR